MGISGLQEGGSPTNHALRFYCSNNEECIQAEKALSTAGINFVKVKSDGKHPILISSHITCRGLREVLSYVAAVPAIKEKYSINWQ